MKVVQTISYDKVGRPPQIAQTQVGEYRAEMLSPTDVMY